VDKKTLDMELDNIQGCIYRYHKNDGISQKLSTLVEMHNYPLDDFLSFTGIKFMTVKNRPVTRVFGDEKFRFEFTIENGVTYVSFIKKRKFDFATLDSLDDHVPYRVDTLARIGGNFMSRPLKSKTGYIVIKRNGQSRIRCTIYDTSKTDVEDRYMMIVHL